MSKKKKILIALAVALALCLAAVAGGFFWYRYTHLKVDGIIYEKNLEVLDLRGADISPEHYDRLRSRMPGTEIRWDVPFQDGRLPNDTRAITLTSLTHEDLERLEYLPLVTEVEAKDCEEYALLEELKARRPDYRVHYDVTLGEGSYPLDTEALTFTGAQVTAQELNRNLAWLPMVKSIHFDRPDPAAMPAAEIFALQESRPELTVTWNQDIYGQSPDIHVTELDISDTAPASLREVEDLAAYFPDLEKLIMCNVPFENEDLAAFRDKMRPEYKVVWLVHIGKMDVRTDETSFMPGKGNKPVRNGECYNMRYLEDLIVVDIGHQGIQDLDWVVGTPHLKYLILADGGPSNIEPRSCLKELIYLEVFGTGLRDATPLIGCTALQDLNVCRTNVEIDGLTQMPWLKNLWISSCGLTVRERETLSAALPNTRIEYFADHPVANGWRKLPNYYAMRDALDMWYMD